MNTARPKYLKTSLLATAIASSLLLTACGGSSGGGGSHHTASKKEQTITFKPISELAVKDTAKLTATASSKLDVIYTTSTPKVCRVESGADKSTVTALAMGECTITANQAGDSSFAAAKAVSITIPIISDTMTLSTPPASLDPSQTTTIELAGKQVSKSLKATIAGDKPQPLTVKSTGKHTAQIAITQEDITKLGMVGDVTLTIKDGDKVLKEQLLNIALPKATGDSFTVKKTGYTECANLDDNHIDCKDKDKLGEGEDGFYATNQDGEIQAGADNTYIKVAHKTDKATEYCVYDPATGLTWEQKTDSGLQANSHKYSWYDTNPKTNGGAKGEEIAWQDEDKDKADTICKGSLDKCNTEVYLKTLNDMNYCGHNDWRLPTRQELIGIRDFGKKDVPFTSSLFNLYESAGKNPGLDFHLTGDSTGSNHYQRMITVNFYSDGYPSWVVSKAYGHVLAVRSNTNQQ